jgi:hypothetical protein
MKKILAFCCAVILFNGCYYDNLEELHPSLPPCDTTGTISFATDITQIMTHSCGSQDMACHNTDASQSGYGLGNYTDVINTIDNSGTFLKSITHDPSINSSKWMPKGSTAKIDNCSIEKIEAWLNRGRLNN